MVTSARICIHPEEKNGMPCTSFPFCRSFLKEDYGLEGDHNFGPRRWQVHKDPAIAVVLAIRLLLYGHCG